MQRLRNQWPLAVIVATFGILWSYDYRGRNKEQPPQIERGFVVEVDQEADIKELLKFSRVSCLTDRITEYSAFPPTDTGKTKKEFILLSFSRRMHSREVINVLDGLDYRAANIRELIQFCRDFPKKHQIIALGSSCRRGVFESQISVPTFWIDDPGLSLDYWDAYWREGIRFLAVAREEATTTRRGR